MKILITGGGTTEKIDEMRVITNQSSGNTSLTLARILSREHEVTLWKSKNVKDDFKEGKEEVFLSCRDLMELFVTAKDQKFDLIIHAAAVGDYEVLKLETSSKLKDGKIPSGLTDLKLFLTPTQKIINEIKNLYPKAYLVGFKLTDDLERTEVSEKIKKLRDASRADMIVHNIIQERYQGVEKFYLYANNNEYLAIDGITELAKNLIKNYKE